MCAPAPLPTPFTLLFFYTFFLFLCCIQYMGQNWGQELHVCECQRLIKACRAA